MKDPRKESCIEFGNLCDRLSVDCSVCPEKIACWYYTGWKAGFITEQEAEEQMDCLTLDKDKLMTRWMKLYMNLMVLRGHSPILQALVSEMHDKMAEMNEYMMGFFDSIGATPEEEKG